MPRTIWIQKQNIGPVARLRHAMAYDRKRRQTYLFGGQTYTQANDGLHTVALFDTWAWDGVSWTQVSDMGPNFGVVNFRMPRRSVAMTYDIQRELMVLYINGGTWLWNGEYWGQVADTGPVRTFEEHEISLAYLPQTAKVYAHGNMGMGTWSLEDGDRWLQVADNGPDKGLQAMICDEQRRRLLLFEGETGVTWEFNADIWQPITSIGPGIGADLQVAYESNRVMAFSNRSTWAWENNQWRQVENMGPGPRIDFALAGNTGLGRTVLFGGSRSLADITSPLGDTWEYAVFPPVT